MLSCTVMLPSEARGRQPGDCAFHAQSDNYDDNVCIHTYIYIYIYIVHSICTYRPHLLGLVPRQSYLRPPSLGTPIS